MLITQLKAKETIVSLAAGKKVFIINCHGCKEVRFPEKEAVELQKELSAEGNVTGIMTTDYICNPENMQLRLQKHMDKIREADLVLVFSCGVGVQTIAEYLEDKMVCAACDTYPVPGFQGVTPLEYKCDQCGECYLNLTGGNVRIYLSAYRKGISELCFQGLLQDVHGVRYRSGHLQPPAAYASRCGQ